MARHENLTPSKKTATVLAPAVIAEYNAALMAHLRAHPIEDNREGMSHRSGSRPEKTTFRGHDLTQEYPRLAGNAVVYCAFQETAPQQPAEAVAEPIANEA